MSYGSFLTLVPDSSLRLQVLVKPPEENRVRLYDIFLPYRKVFPLLRLLCHRSASQWHFFWGELCASQNKILHDGFNPV